MDYVGAFLVVRRKVGNLVTSIKINTIEIELTKYLELGKESIRIWMSTLSGLATDSI